MDKLTFAQLIGFIASMSREVLDRSQIEHVERLLSYGAPPRVQDVEDLMNAMATDRKIEAIKAFRTLTGYGLKESKDAVERVMHRERVA